MIARFVKGFVNFFGFEIRRISPMTRFDLQFHEILKRNNFNLVLDVGANFGQFAEEVIDSGYSGRVVSFEPLSFAYAELQKRADLNKNWIIHERCALGSEETTTSINIAGNYASSSLLDMTSLHTDAAPHTANIGVETVSVHKLDNILPVYANDDDKILLKIDTQGFELQVLEGASGILDKVDGILIEMSFVELYSGQILWKDLMNWIEQRGFNLWSIDQYLVDPKSFKTLQAEAVFLRN